MEHTKWSMYGGHQTCLREQCNTEDVAGSCGDGSALASQCGQPAGTDGTTEISECVHL